MTRMMMVQRDKKPPKLTGTRGNTKDQTLNSLEASWGGKTHADDKGRHPPNRLQCRIRRCGYHERHRYKRHCAQCEGMWGNRGTAPRILKLGIKRWWVSASRHSPSVPRDTGPSNHYTEGWLSPRTGSASFEEKPLPLPGIEPWILQPIL